MKILVLSFYFRPDISAGSFRNSALVDELAKIAEAMQGQKISIDVLSSVPSRYDVFRPVENSLHPTSASVKVKKIWVPTVRLGIFGEVLKFLFFFVGVLTFCVGKQYHVVYASTSRLMTGWLGAIVAYLTGSKFFVEFPTLFSLKQPASAERVFSQIQLCTR